VLAPRRAGPPRCRDCASWRPIYAAANPRREECCKAVARERDCPSPLDRWIPRRWRTTIPVPTSPGLLDAARYEPPDRRMPLQPWLRTFPHGLWLLPDARFASLPRSFPPRLESEAKGVRSDRREPCDRCLPERVARADRSVCSIPGGSAG